MYIVTLPNGRTYTYGARNATAARALAARTGGTLTTTVRPVGGDDDDAYDRARDARREQGLTGRPGYYSRY